MIWPSVEGPNDVSMMKNGVEPLNNPSGQRVVLVDGGSSTN